MPWWQHFIVPIGVFGIFAAILLLIGLAVPRRLQGRLRLAALLLLSNTALVFLAARAQTDFALPVGHALEQAIGVLWWSALAWFLVQCLDVFVWRGALGGIALPRLLTDAVAGV